MPPARLISCTYAGLTVPSTGYLVTGVHGLEGSYDRLAFDLDVVVYADDAATLATRAAALKEAFRKPDQDLSVTIGGATFTSGSQSGSTLLNSRSRWRLLPTFRTKLSQGFRVEAEGELPADLTGRAGRRTSSVRVITEPEEWLRVELEATWTALPAQPSAEAQARAQWVPWSDAIKTALGGAWQASSEVSFERDDQDKVCTGRAGYRQQVIDEGASGADHASYRVTSYLVSTDRTYTRAWTGSKAQAPWPATVTFEVSVKKSVTTDLKAVWAGSVRAYLGQLLLRGDLAGGEPKHVGESVRFDVWNNRIAGSVTYLVLMSPVLEAVRSTTYAVFHGKSLVPILGQDQDEKEEHTGPRVTKWSVTMRTVERAGSNMIDDVMVPQAVSEAEGEGYVLIDHVEHDEPTTYLLQGGDSFDVVERARVYNFQWKSKGRPTTGGRSSGRRVVTGGNTSYPGASGGSG